MDFVKKIPPLWFAVAVAVAVLVVMLFRQRRSDYTPPSGTSITMMDLEEFSAFSPEQKANYVKKLAEYKDRLTEAASTNSMSRYRMFLDDVMVNSMPPPPPPVTTKPLPPPLTQQPPPPPPVTTKPPM
jgi:outer membrane biosynthesis protein TonB